MSEKTNIDWCDSTFNPWWGCRKVSEGCLNCYAERDNDERFKRVKQWGKDYYRTSKTYWEKAEAWAKEALRKGKMRRVFVGSMMDAFDADAPEGWRRDLWRLLGQVIKYDSIEWVLLTKRPENIFTMLPAEFQGNPMIRIGVTAETDALADERTDQLLTSWAGPNFVSVEPMLEAIELPNMGHLHWVICGAESGPKARPMDLGWVRGLRHQCLAWEVPFFFKQAMVDGRRVKLPELDGRVWAQRPRIGG